MEFIVIKIMVHYLEEERIVIQINTIYLIEQVPHHMILELEVDLD